jgi:hypothetical protein
MAGDDSKFTTPRNPNLRQALADAGRSLRRMRRSLLEGSAAAERTYKRAIPPETREALAELGRSASDDDPAAVEPVRAVAASDTPASAPVAQTPQRQGRGLQTNRVWRVLPMLYPPDGKPTFGLTFTAVRQKVIEYLEAERKGGQTPENERDLPLSVSLNVVRNVINEIGWAL